MGFFSNLVGGFKSGGQEEETPLSGFSKYLGQKPLGYSGKLGETPVGAMSLTGESPARSMNHLQGLDSQQANTAENPASGVSQDSSAVAGQEKSKGSFWSNHPTLSKVKEFFQSGGVTYQPGDDKNFNIPKPSIQKEGIGHSIFRYAVPALFGMTRGIGAIPGIMAAMSQGANQNAQFGKAMQTYGDQQMKGMNTSMDYDAAQKKLAQQAADAAADRAEGAKDRSARLAVGFRQTASDKAIADKRKYMDILKRAKINASDVRDEEMAWADAYEKASKTYSDEGDGL
jgi:hypothetical protein